MSLNKPPRRRSFQIHLSTAIVLMFVSGLLIWANVQIGWRYYRAFDNIEWDDIEHGWPSSALEFHSHINNGNPDYEETEKHYAFNWTSVFTNAVVAIGIFSAVWWLCEWLIHRRAAGKVRES